MKWRDASLKNKGYIIIKMSETYVIVPFKSERLKGISFAIDKEDHELIEQLPNWYLSGAQNNYATSDWRGCPTGRKKIRLHRLLLLGIDDNDPNHVVDHINGDTLDNRRCNLRVVSKSANVAHRANLNKNNISGARGVYWCKTSNRWIACIRHDEDVWWKKSFEDKDEAIREIEEKRKLYNALHGLSARQVERLPELEEPNKLMKELYEQGTYVHNVRSDQSKADYNERRRQQTAEKREKLKEKLLKQPQTYEIITQLRRIEGDERRSNSKLTGERIPIEERRKVINEGRRIKSNHSN